MNTVATHTASQGGAPLLEIDNLRIAFDTPQGRTEAVRGVSLRMGRERLAVVGESGSGKSITFRSLLGLLPASASVSADRMRLEGQDLLGLDARAQRALRGRRIGMVVQDPRQGLDPLMTIGRQLAEMLRLHGKVPRQGVRQRVRDLLAEVHIREPDRVADLYPHQVSGGMAQRAMLAMMLSAEPDLLIADEATSALDAVVRHHMLALIDEQVRLRGMGLILISHDLDLVARYADRVIVMYAGRVMEELPAGGMALAATHPYTRGLMACRPSLDHLGEALPVLERDPAWQN
ncbi:peptide/nickel transport system ATP-binding protein [Variovorax boronicumulans]|uniref:Peptide/nickel transport system ATP-binding protein n=1 Tax=Variovorax boronicumulans TaxID=436515 RepID=A0AAW8DTI4_9BURK|nr:ABC transporter ATP-binding protein [Variovorax boronicumulans]MDP9877590.1 peptide/nickel transport system ATP-binding protein [Variovorax boronicumulans]MDP9922875.1 peptide/nickel transport system ATP-binding protein [Variovorax boronicumulans]